MDDGKHSEVFVNYTEMHQKALRMHTNFYLYIRLIFSIHPFIYPCYFYLRQLRQLYITFIRLF